MTYATLDQQATPQVEAQVNALLEQHQGQRAEYQTSLQTMWGQRQAQLSAQVNQAQTEYAEIQTQTQSEVGVLKAEWQAENQAIQARVKGELHQAGQKTAGKVEQRVKEGEKKADAILGKAEKEAKVHKSQTEVKADGKVGQARKQANDALSGVGLPMENRYEAKAVKDSGVIMRRVDSGDAEEERRQREEEERKRKEEEAKRKAEEALKRAIEEAQRLLAEMQKKVEEMLEAAKRGAVEEVEAARLEIQNMLDKHQETVETVVNEALNEYPLMAEAYSNTIQETTDRARTSVNNMAGGFMDTNGYLQSIDKDARNEIMGYDAEYTHIALSASLSQNIITTMEALTEADALRRGDGQCTPALSEKMSPLNRETTFVSQEPINELSFLEMMGEFAMLRPIMGPMIEATGGEDLLDMTAPDLYIEGVAGQFTFGKGGYEKVYDFKTNQIGYFDYEGISLGSDSFGGSVGGYIGVGVKGSTAGQHIGEAYKGAFSTAGGSGGLNNLISLGVDLSSSGSFVNLDPESDNLVDLHPEAVKTITVGLSAGTPGFPINGHVAQTDYGYRGTEWEASKTDSEMIDYILTNEMHNPHKAAYLIYLTLANEHTQLEEDEEGQAKDEPKLDPKFDGDGIPGFPIYEYPLDPEEIIN